MPVHVVREPAAVGENPDAAAKPKAAKETSPMFWLILGVVGGAVAMHFTARKMQEYAGGMYTTRARIQSRLGMGTPEPPTYLAQVPVDDEDEGGWFG